MYRSQSAPWAGIVRTVGALVVLGTLVACASTPTPRTDVATLAVGEYRLSASVSVRNDTEHRERFDRLAIAAVLVVGDSGTLTLSADTGPCWELGPSNNLLSSNVERRFDCGSSLFAIEGRAGRPVGTVTQEVDDFVRSHTGCRKMIRQNERDICVEDAYTVLHRRIPRSAELKSTYVEVEN